MGLKRPEDRAYFFDAGVRFQCQQCGACCEGEPGVVYVDQPALAAIAEFLGQDAQILAQEYLEPFLNGFKIREDSQGRCCFHEEGCRIYPVRPDQCRNWPFWFENMRSRKNWTRVVRGCPGIGKGRLYRREEILKVLGTQTPRKKRG